jgi:hypothetical protein
VKKIDNPGFIIRRRRIGNIGTWGGMITLIGGMVITFVDPKRLDLSYGALLVGFILITLGTTFTNRWGRIPPPDEAVDALLKGLDDKYTIVHFRLGAEHVLLSPSGLVVLYPKYEHGQISYDGKRWHQTGVSKVGQLFGVEALGNPVLDAAAEANSLEGRLRKILKDEVIPEIRPIILFLNERTQVEAEGSPIPAVHASKIKEFIRRMPKTATLTTDQQQRVLEYIGKTN